MGIYSNQLPQLGDKVFITDAGLETELCFLRNIDLPEFAAYVLLRNQEGYELLYDYYASFAALARQYGMGAVLETTTWRANPDWAKKIGDSPETLKALNLKAVELLLNVRREYETQETPIVVSGNLGPRGDGYQAGDTMTRDQAHAYHQSQIDAFFQAGADLVTALTMTYVEEATGIVLAGQQAGVPVVISFTLETDGRLPTGMPLAEAIAEVDHLTDSGPAYYMINCAHPTHFAHLFNEPGNWQSRIKGIRGNASCMSHEELDNATELDAGDPADFGQQCHQLQVQLPALNILGGCCGTDHRHIEAICRNFQENRGEALAG